ncbi:hypothetical protein LJ737_14150 [Hymenobacter sp. 15J16-1T3B]|uniref:hypothetical protein n=1 Tax=Hymenobacter sp. 15J16-1T3B TaxID=2886941 RepID=UPI001D11352A|nr:hypothetical protein [Hymenobacter sp. 15J16-1T3B]MCC3158387.1 hypothetical protein [Hymenobacter sp. 15J16-1T3B]
MPGKALLYAVKCALLLPMPALAQVKYISLVEQKLTAPLRCGRVQQVIDARADRVGIGWVQKGLDNKRTLAALREPLPVALTDLLATGVGAATTPYAMRVHRLRVSELTANNSETGTAELVVDFLRMLPDQRYELVLRAAGRALHRDVDVTARHPVNIAAAVQQCLTQLDSAAARGLTVHAVLTAAEVAQPVTPLLALLPFPIEQAAAAPAAGIYRSFQAFRYNQPDAQHPTTLTRSPSTKAGWAGTDEIEVHYVGAGGQRTPVRDAWGYCDGKHTYILHRRHFYQLERTTEGYRFVAPSAPDAGAVNAAALTGGLVGGLIAANNTSSYRQELWLNLLTGAVEAEPLAPLAEPPAHYLPAVPGQPARLVLYGRTPAAATVEVNGQPYGALSADSVQTTLVWQERRGPAQLCIRATGQPEACASVYPYAGQTVYLKWMPGALVEMPAREAQFDLRRGVLRQQQAQRKLAGRPK